MGVERVDYYSEDEYQFAVQAEVDQMRQWEEELAEQARLAEIEDAG
jgi:hypothetical protein